MCVAEGYAMGEKREPRPWNEERAAAIGGEFGLGALVKVLRSRKFPAMTGWGALLGFLTVVAGVPVIAGMTAGHYTLTTRVTIAAALGALFLFSCVLVGFGVSRSVVDSQVFRYSGGLAEVTADEAEPRVARWADVREFTVWTSGTEETEARLTRFALRATAGTQLSGLRRYRHSELHDLVTAIGGVLAAHIVPMLTRTYESGEQVVLGTVRVNQEGIAVDPADPARSARPAGSARSAGLASSAASPIPWPEIRWISVRHLPHGGAMRIAHQITIHRSAGRPDHVIGLSGVPNGLFLPRLLAHAGTRNGVPVYGYEEPGEDTGTLPTASAASPVPAASPRAGEDDR
jgi:hypothetical protein